jgi:hypothetical protein
MYEQLAPLIRFLNTLSVPVPNEFLSVASIALNSHLQQTLQQTDTDPTAIKGLIREAELNNVALDTTTLEYTLRKRLENEATIFSQHPDDVDALKRLNRLLDVAGGLPFPLSLPEVQNLCYPHLAKPVGPVVASNGKNGTNGSKSTNGSNGHNSQQEIDPGREEWEREVAAAREKLRIQGPQ